MRKFYALFLMILFTVSVSFGQEKASYTTTQTGDWFSGTTWTGGLVPPVSGGHTITVNHDVTVAGANWRGRDFCTITIAVGKTVIHSSGSWGSRDGTLTINGTYKNTGGLLYLTSGTVNVNSTYEVGVGGVIKAGLTWGGSSVLKLSSMTNAWPVFQGDDYNTVEIVSSGLTQNMEFLKDDISIFDNVLLTNTGSYAIITDAGDNSQVSGNFTITSNGKLIIGATDGLTVDGVFTNTTNSNLKILSTSSGTGSLISGSSPNGTLECYISSGAWHLVGPPNGTLSAADAFLSGYMQTWADGNPGSWTTQEGDPALTRGRGAAYYFYSNFTADLYGNLDGTAETESGLGNAGGADDGYHLLANPFPCAVDLDNCTFSGSMSTTYQVYNGSSYVTMAGNVIPASQAFFVQVNNGASGQSVVFNTAAKTHNTANVAKATNDDNDFIQLSLTDIDGKSNDELIIRFNEDATDAYDSKYDGHKIIGNQKAGEIMAQIADSEFACVLGIPFPNNSKTVEVNFTKGDASEYTLELQKNLLNNIEVSLEDVETGFVVDLTSNPVYTFTAEESTEGRFLLHFKNATAVQELSNNDVVKIWNHKDNVYLQQDQPTKGEIYIYDISGKLIDSRIAEASNVQRFIFKHLKGTYIINFVTEDNSISQKIIK